MHKTGGCSLWLEMRRIIHHTQAFKGLKEQFTPLCSASAVAECCNAFFAVKLQKCGCVDKDYIFIFGWPFPLNLELESNVSLKGFTVGAVQQLVCSDFLSAACRRARLSASRLTCEHLLSLLSALGSEEHALAYTDKQTLHFELTNK